MKELILMNRIIFTQPIWIVIGLLLVVGMFFGFLLFDKKKNRAMKRFVTGKQLDKLRSSISKPKRLLKRGGLVVCVFLLFITLARPQFGYEWKEVKRKGIDILFAIDASRSMLAEDIKPNRLERVKMGVMDFVNKLEGDRVGLLPFSGNSFLLCPFTLDYQAFEQSLDAVNTEIIPKKGTDLASAINEASSIFEEAGNNHRVLVIVTDGEDLQGEALAAAKDAVEKNVIIYSLGVGSIEGELIPLSHPQYGTSYLKDSSGKLVKTKLDEEGLKKIADITGGVYAPFGRGGEGLEKIYQEKLSLVPKEELTQRMQKVAVERYQWPLGGAIVILVVVLAIGDRRKLPKAGAVLNRDGQSILVLLFIFIVNSGQTFAETGQKMYNEAVKKYQSGEASDAKDLFQKSIESSDDLNLQSRSYYNIGNALFKQGAVLLSQGEAHKVIKLWEKSIEAYEGALSLDKLDEDAQQNRQYVQQKIDELKKQEEKENKQAQEDKKQKGSQDQQEKDEQGKDEQGKDEQGKDEQGKDEQGKDEQGKDEQGKDEQGKDEQGKGEQGKDEQSKGEQSKDEQGKDEQGKGEQGEEKGVSASDKRRVAGKMTKEEALQLLKSLEGDEERLLIVPYGKRDQYSPDNTTKGKDW